MTVLTCAKKRRAHTESKRVGTVDEKVEGKIRSSRDKHNNNNNKPEHQIKTNAVQTQ